MFNFQTSVYCLKKRIIYCLFRSKRKQTFTYCGSEYGGFSVADIIRNIKQPIVYSFGIGEDLTFSEEMIDQFGAEVYAFDPTPKSIEYVKKSKLFANSHFHFYPWGISDRDGKTEFYLPENDDYVSGSVIVHNDVRKESIKVDMRSLKSIMSQLEHNNIDLLKMDVEGSEFEVIHSLSYSECEKVGQICLEIHERFFDKPIAMLWHLLHEMKKRKFVLVNVSKQLDTVTFIKDCN